MEAGWRSGFGAVAGGAGAEAVNGRDTWKEALRPSGIWRVVALGPRPVMAAFQRCSG